MNLNTLIVHPFAKNRQTMSSHTEGVKHIIGAGPEVVNLVPAVIEDAYNFLGVIMNVRHSFFDMPNLMTLGKFRYLLSQYSSVMGLQAPLCLDPFSTMTAGEQAQEMRYLDEDTFNNLNNVLVFCVVNSAEELIDMPLDAGGHILPWVDKYRTISTNFGILQVIYRCVQPSVVSSENTRRCLLRLVASTSIHISPRSAMLLTDMKFPLSLIPGVSNYPLLERVAKGAPSFADLYASL